MGAARAVYFFYFAGFAFFVPYIALYYQSLGLSGSQIGILTGLSPVIGVLAAPSWSALADATHQHKRILSFSLLAASFCVLALSTVSQYAWLLAIVTAFAFFLAPIIPLVDNSVVEQLGVRRDEYGKQRVWGSYGWGLAALVSGLLLQRFGLSFIFYAYAGLVFFGFLASTRFPVNPVSIGIKLGRNVLALFSNRRWLLFLGVTFVLGAGMAMIGNYFTIYLKSLGTPASLMGVALALATLSEIPFLFFSDRMMRRFGIAGLLVIGGSVFGLRALAFAAVSAPWQAMVLQLVHGLTFGLVLVAGVEFTSRIAPPGLGATAQGIFSAVFNGLGYAFGSLLGGILLDAVGVQAMYRVAGIGALLAVLVFVTATKLRPVKLAQQGSAPR